MLIVQFCQTASLLIHVHSNTHTHAHTQSKRENIKPLDIPVMQEQNVHDKYVEIFNFSSIILYLQNKFLKGHEESFH